MGLKLVSSSGEIVFINSKIHYERIAEQRKKQGMTQKQLAAVIGKRASQISAWENCRKEPRRETLYRIADALGVDPIYFMTEDQ